MEHEGMAMEYYVAEDKRPLERCLDDVRSCDVYIGIFAWRYGIVADGQTESITVLEYRAARDADAGKECLIFLIREDAPWPPTLMASSRGRRRALKQRALPARIGELGQPILGLGRATP
jgi:uncharacterized protein DUF4062